MRKIILLISLLGAMAFVGCSDMGNTVTDGNNPPDTLVTFAADIQPIFQANCANCHINGAINGDLQLDSYALLMSTGIHTPVIIPFQPDSSYLVLKIEGRAAGDRMPAGGMLSSTDSLKIRIWVTHGAQDN